MEKTENWLIQPLKGEASRVDPDEASREMEMFLKATGKA